MRFLRRKSDHPKADLNEYPYVGRISADSYREAAADPFVKALVGRAARKAGRGRRADP